MPRKIVVTFSLGLGVAVLLSGCAAFGQPAPTASAPTPTPEPEPVEKEPPAGNFEFVDEPLPHYGDIGFSDPILFVNGTTGYNYTLVADNTSDASSEVWVSDDLDSWEQLHDDITPNVSEDGSPGFNDGIYVNGTYYLYRTEYPPATSVWTGPNLTALEPANVTIEHSDVGVIHHDGTFYVYTEAYPSSTASGDGIRLLTSPNGVTNWTDRGVVLDLRDRDWHTGDPEIRLYDGRFYMWIDRSTDHPSYHIALAESDDLFNWTITNEAVTDVKGGDATVGKRLDGQGYVMFTEYTGEDEENVGRFNSTEVDWQ